MGQYHYTVNLDQREFLDHYALGYGAKEGEQCGFLVPLGDILYGLLVYKEGRGGGDIPDPTLDPEAAYFGRWHGDRVAVVGDYATRTDLPPRFHADQIYNWCSNARQLARHPSGMYAGSDGTQHVIGETHGYTDITPAIVPVVQRLYHLRILESDGWCERAFDPEYWRHSFPADQAYSVLNRHAFETGVYLYAHHPEARPVLEAAGFVATDSRGHDWVRAAPAAGVPAAGPAGSQGDPRASVRDRLLLWSQITGQTPEGLLMELVQEIAAVRG